MDSYFDAYERIAATLNWTKDVWTLLLQCKLVGKAQEVCVLCSQSNSLDYDVKATVLCAYDLVPEACMYKVTEFAQGKSKKVKSVSGSVLEFI